MSIDEAIRRIDNHNYIHQSKEPRAIYISEAFDVAKEAMRKYQYIQEIYKSWRTGDYKGSTECMEEIGEVLQDGNVN